MTISRPNLFSPIRIGRYDLEHRVVLAPLTRRRAQDNGVHIKEAVDYYGIRASRPGSLLISEATAVSVNSWGMKYSPGIYTEEQLEAWKKIFDKIHEYKSIVFVQLWAMGWSAHATEQREKGGHFAAPSALRSSMGHTEDIPDELTIPEIKQLIADFALAAKKIVEIGGDGVEIHGANGYLVDQFLHENSNHRTDEYGGSIENRARFGLELVDAVVDAIGADRVGLRLSPHGSFNGVNAGISPIPQFSYIVAELEKRGLNGKRLAFIHLVEPRANGSFDADARQAAESNSFVRDIWTGILIKAGAFTRDLAFQQAAEDPNLLIAFGRYFVSNPDLPDRLENDYPLTKYDRSVFYTQDLVGYTDYPVYKVQGK